MPRRYVKPPEGFDDFKQLSNDQKRDRLRESAAEIAYWAAREIKLDQARIQKKYKPHELFNLAKQFGVTFDKTMTDDDKGFQVKLPAAICEGWLTSLQRPVVSVAIPEEGKPTEGEKKEEVLES